MTTQEQEINIQEIWKLFKETDKMFLILMDFMVWGRKWETTAILASFSRKNALKKPGFCYQMGRFENNHKIH